MQTQRETILNQLSEHGWKVIPLEDYKLDLWADEIWMLESTWSPIGAIAYVTFLVDLMISQSSTTLRTRKKSEWVSAVMASRHNKSEVGNFEMSLNQGWEKRLPDFFEHLDKIRNGVAK